MTELLIPVGVMFGLAVFLAAGLALADRVFRVEENPRVALIERILPGSNCGGCPYGGCAAYARALDREDAPPNMCALGGREVADTLARLLGKEAKAEKKKIATLICQGGKIIAGDVSYIGITDCRAVAAENQTTKICTYGCLGLGTCARVCPLDAIEMGDDGLPIIDAEKCTACGICIRECPRDVLELIPLDQPAYLACRSRDSGKTVKEYCKRGCFTCKICVNPKFVPEGWTELKGNLPRLMVEKISDWEKIKPGMDKCPANCYLWRVSGLET